MTIRNLKAFYFCINNSHQRWMKVDKNLNIAPDTGVSHDEEEKRGPKIDENEVIKTSVGIGCFVGDKLSLSDK
jgi:hypothetical protein